MPRRAHDTARALGIDHAPQVPAALQAVIAERYAAAAVVKAGPSPRVAAMVAESNARQAEERRRLRREGRADPLARKRRKRPEPTVQPGDPHRDDDPETVEHVRLVAVLEEAGLVYHHSPNGERRTREGGGRLRRMGTRRGWPDLCIYTRPPARPEVRVVVIEMKQPELRPKTERTGRWSGARPEQRACLADIEACDGLSEVFYTAEDAVTWLDALGYPVRAAVERLRAARHAGWRRAA